MPNNGDGSRPDMPPPPLSSESNSRPPPPPPSSLSSPQAPSSSRTYTSLLPPSPSPSPSSTSSSSSSTLLISASIASALSIAIITLLIYCLCTRRRRRRRRRSKNWKKKSQGPDGASPSHAIQEEPILPAQLQNVLPPLLPRSTASFFLHCTGSFGRSKPPPPPPPPPPAQVVAPIKQAHESSPAPSKRWFSYEELEVATDGFSASNKLGEGGFGCVYKGVLSDGQLVAVKQLKEGVVQGEKQFQAEVEIISRVHHRHLVSLVGYCISEHHRLLVYHFLANDTLEHHLHRRRSGPALDWPTRLRIACGAARGLAYLHEDCHPRIIHRDIKSSNILLDDNFEAQVSDFGLARLTSDTDIHATTRVMGTFGYLAPEYASSGKLSEKSDVFSFGVVLLELLTGRKPVDLSQPVWRASIVEWVRPIVGQMNSEEYLDIVADPALNGAYDPKQILRMLETAIACVSHFPSKRPRMGQVVTTLESQISLSDLNKPIGPLEEIKRNDFELAHGNMYNDIEMRTFNRLPIGVQEFEEWHANAQFKMNNESCEMMNSNGYQQTMASRETRSTSGPIMSVTSSFS